MSISCSIRCGGCCRATAACHPSWRPHLFMLEPHWGPQTGGGGAERQCTRCRLAEGRNSRPLDELQDWMGPPLEREEWFRRFRRDGIGRDKKKGKDKDKNKDGDNDEDEDEDEDWDEGKGKELVKRKNPGDE